MAPALVSGDAPGRRQLVQQVHGGARGAAGEVHLPALNPRCRRKALGEDGVAPAHRVRSRATAPGRPEPEPVDRGSPAEVVDQVRGVQAEGHVVQEAQVRPVLPVKAGRVARGVDRAELVRVEPRDQVEKDGERRRAEHASQGLLDRSPQAFPGDARVERRVELVRKAVGQGSLRFSPSAVHLLEVRVVVTGGRPGGGLGHVGREVLQGVKARVHAEGPPLPRLALVQEAHP